MQIWFQNRRMKDKRQRLAMTWPYDPAIYAYLLNAAAAASLHTHYQTYVFPPSTAGHRPSPTFLPSPFASYYASMGLQRAAAAYSAQPLANVDLIAKSSSIDKSLIGPTSPGSPAGPPTLIPHSTSSQGSGQSHGITGLCACSACCPVISGLQQLSTSGSEATSLFQPYKCDIERSP